MINILFMKSACCSPCLCYELLQRFMVTGLFAGQHNTKLHGTITGVILFFCSTFPPSSWDQTNTISIPSEKTRNTVYLWEIVVERWKEKVGG